MKKFRAAALFGFMGLVGLGISMPSDAGEPGQEYTGSSNAGFIPKQACGGYVEGKHCLVVWIDHARRIKFEDSAHQVIVGNPAIADAAMLNKKVAIITAKSVGSTNILVLDQLGEELTSYEVFVREGETKRVTLRQGSKLTNFQCAPNCERTLSMTDTVEEHQTLVEAINAETGVNKAAIGTMEGLNPNSQSQK